MNNQTDSYLSLESEQQGLYRDRGSKFIAYAFPLADAHTFEDRLLEIRKEHPKARHFCYAWRLDPGGDQYRYSDDGEPGGSAGLPIYNQLLSAELFYTAIVVVRYFGGKKLGVPGLIQAYKESSQDALNQAEPVRKFITDAFQIRFGFNQTGPVMRALNETQAEILENGFDQGPVIRCRIRRSGSAGLKHTLLAHLLKRDPSDILGDEKVEGFSIEHIT